MEAPGIKEDALRYDIEDPQISSSLPDSDEPDFLTESLNAPVAPEYYDWRETYPELQILLDNFDDILEEAEKVVKWKQWPENHYSEGNNDWTVFPFMHCFPAYDASRITWVPPTCEHCPKTVEVLRQIPSLRTALLSRLGPQTNLSAHTGWEDLANHVLRCHLCLKIPGGRTCGLEVNGKVQYHSRAEIIVFDDSKVHKAWNDSDEERLILIVDLERPLDIPKGTAEGGHTTELDRFITTFVDTF